MKSFYRQKPAVNCAKTTVLPDMNKEKEDIYGNRFANCDLTRKIGEKEEKNATQSSFRSSINEPLKNTIEQPTESFVSQIQK